MKRTLQYIVAVLILWTALLNSHATTNVSLTIDHGTNAALHWTSETNQAFIIGYRSTLSATNPWTLLTNVLAATNGIQTGFTNQGAIPSSSSGFYVVSEFSEDFDGDGVDNGTELLNGTDPLVFDDSLDDASYPDAPSVYSGEEVFNYDTSSGTAGNLGPFLYANSSVANTMVTTEPTPGELHLKWTTTVVDHAFGFASVKPMDESPTANFTGTEAKILHDAFDEGTSLTTGAISNPNQAKVDQVPIELLQRYEEYAIAKIDDCFKKIQQVNAGTGNWNMRAQIAQIHTQWTREQAICRSLHTRLGRALGKVLPLLGGVFIIANAADNAQDFINAAQAYSNDILRGDDETGDAAIFAAVCNNIAPGSSNLVLGYLLR